MKFGFKTIPFDTTWAAILDVWRAADDIPLFESGWMSDHLYAVHPAPGTERGAVVDRSCPSFEGWVPLAALAHATQRLRLGTMVSPVALRHPALFAKMATEVDIISDGRLEIGLGACAVPEYYEDCGIPLGPWKERFDRLEEAVEVIVSLFTREATTFSGRHFQLHEAHSEPKPVQRPHPPICIGGFGERRTLPLVARWAQHWNLPGGFFKLFGPKRARLEELCAEIGRDPKEIRVSSQLFWQRDQDPKEVADQAAEVRDAGAEMALIAIQAPFDPGMPGRLADALSPLWSPGDR